MPVPDRHMGGRTDRRTGGPTNIMAIAWVNSQVEVQVNKLPNVSRLFTLTVMLLIVMQAWSMWYNGFCLTARDRMLTSGITVSSELTFIYLVIIMRPSLYQAPLCIASDQSVCLFCACHQLENESAKLTWNLAMSHATNDWFWGQKVKVTKPHNA